METPNTSSLSAWWGRLGVKETEIARVYRGFNAWAEPFRQASEANEEEQNDQG
jgi:hypothetical protein